MKALIKKIIPHFIYIKLKFINNYIHQLIIPFFAKTPILSHIYFTLFNRSYLREQFAILQGSLDYKSRVVSNSGGSNPLLRRNIHRIEKGLIMRPLKPIFALDYIEKTHCAYLLACKSETYCPQELKWAKDVLAKYYQSVDLDKSALLSKLSAEFNKYITTNFSEVERYIPYENKELPTSELNYQQFNQFIKLRRSTRWFKQKKVCHQKLKQAISVASQAPSACNRQPYKFYVVDQQPLLSQISKLAIGSGGFADNIPCIIVLVGDYSNYEQVRDRHVIYIDTSLAAMQFMQTLPTLGLSSCPLNWPELAVVDKQLTELLKLKNHQKTVMLIAVGEASPEGGIPYSQKKTAEQLVHFVE